MRHKGTIINGVSKGFGEMWVKERQKREANSFSYPLYSIICDESSLRSI